MVCPKCNHSWSGKSGRVKCFSCGHVFNHSYSPVINGPAIVVVGFLLTSICPTLGVPVLLCGGLKTWLEN